MKFLKSFVNYFLNLFTRKSKQLELSYNENLSEDVDENVGYRVSANSTKEAKTVATDEYKFFYKYSNYEILSYYPFSEYDLHNKQIVEMKRLYDDALSFEKEALKKEILSVREKTSLNIDLNFRNFNGVLEKLMIQENVVITSNTINCITKKESCKNLSFIKLAHKIIKEYNDKLSPETVYQEQFNNPLLKEFYEASKFEIL